MVPGVAGSNPVCRPTFLIGKGGSVFFLSGVQGILIDWPQLNGTFPSLYQSRLVLTLNNINCDIECIRKQLVHANLQLIVKRVGYEFEACYSI